MKAKFIRTTLTLSLLLMVAAPAASFAGTNCNREASVKYFGMQDFVKNEACLRFDCNKDNFVPKKNQNCGSQNQGMFRKPGLDCNNNNNNCNNNSCVKPDAPNRPDKPNKPDIPNVPDKPSKPEAPNKPDAPNISVGAYEKQVVTLVNQERSKVGLAPLSLNTKLANVAEVKAEDMRDSNYFSHTSPNYGSPFDMMKEFGITYSSAGENIAKGQKSPESVMNGWMNSSGHKANILNSNFEQIGVGYTTDSNGNTYWVQMFIK